MGRMFNPPHAGESIREDILPALGMTLTEAAKQLGVARVTLSRLIHGQSGVSADMARRLEAWLGGPKHGPSAESWLRMQADYDLWQAMQQPAPNVVRARTSASCLFASMAAISECRSLPPVQDRVGSLQSMARLNSARSGSLPFGRRQYSENRPFRWYDFPLARFPLLTPSGRLRLR